MRLSHIKLAGFKSFVDPTHIPVPGRLVGVVGPNGCGKSNVIDAVRWVLGESSARHLRGETMQDVIFNGSGERKPSNRASVELVFDNALGKAGGPWSKYAEISVKRVLERDGESAYFVNNVHVRRRDVADIFLGTGLGGRAYAIIEQGMISRIVDARPEELRTFLEEAAGISKYRERRKETEQRLEDTRENLARVDDILQELTKQLSHLEEQAEVAGRYRALEAELKLTQHLLWLLRKQDAAASRTRLQRELDQVAMDLEAETAHMRELESRVEKLRVAHYAASDTVHASQGAMYEANAAAARLEQSLEHLRESRRRVDNQIATLSRSRTEPRHQLDGPACRTGRAACRAGRAVEQLEECREQERHEAQLLPAAEQVFSATRSEADRLAQDLARHRQEEQVELTRQVTPPSVGSSRSAASGWSRSVMDWRTWTVTSWIASRASCASSTIGIGRSATRWHRPRPDCRRWSMRIARPAEAAEAASRELARGGSAEPRWNCCRSRSAAPVRCTPGSTISSSTASAACGRAYASSRAGRTRWKRCCASA